MWQRLVQTLLTVSLIAALLGCANPSIVPLSPDTYMLTRTDKGGIFGNPSAMKADVLREASEFATAQGKVAIPVSMRETPLVVGVRFASIEYQFRVVDKTDPEARRVSLVPRPDVVIEKTEKSSIDIKTRDQTERQKDVYAELIKLDDLRKRGILSDAEFDAQKRKLLEAK